jgi:putative SOS response-associated peptidase YedK
MWTSMSNTKRCIVPMEGFYEWLSKGKDRVLDPNFFPSNPILINEQIPYYIRHPTSPLLYLAGLYDSVVYEGETEPTFTYTIITTDSNKQLSFLHDRMPVILEPGSQEMLDWLDPTVKMWNPKLQGILKSYEGELKVDQVGMEVNKVGSDGVGLTVPVEEKKGNIKNFFGAKKMKGEVKSEEVNNSTEAKDDIDEKAVARMEKGTEEKEPVKTKDKEALVEGAKKPSSELEEHKSENSERKSETELSLAVDDSLDIPNEGRKRKGSPSGTSSKEPETSESAPKKQQKLEGAFESQVTTSNNFVMKTPTKSPAKKGGKAVKGPAGVPKITSFFKK